MKSNVVEIGQTVVGFLCSHIAKEEDGTAMANYHRCIVKYPPSPQHLIIARKNRGTPFAV